MKTLEAWYCVPPERDDPVIQLFIAGCGPQWGEVSRSDGKLVLEVFPARTGESWVLSVEELLVVLRLADERLRD